MGQNDKYFMFNRNIEKARHDKGKVQLYISKENMKHQRKLCSNEAKTGLQVRIFAVFLYLKKFLESIVA
jgi:hypothetical protein